MNEMKCSSLFVRELVVRSDTFERFVMGECELSWIDARSPLKSAEVPTT